MKIKLSFKKFFIALSTLAISSSIIAAVVYKFNHEFRPTIMNYESYISDDGKEIINQKFDYKTFKELNEFSRAIDSQKVVGGVGSDYQIARLILDKKITKVDYTKIFRNHKEYENKNNLQFFTKNGMLKKSEVAKYLRPETLEHLDSYNQYLVDAENKRIDYDHDGVADEMWEFLFPYFIQDKVVAYTTGKYNSNDKEIPLRPSSYKKLTDNQRENGIAFKKQDMISILQTLSKYDFKHFQWTEAIRDNYLIGSEIENKDVKNGNTYSGHVTSTNYQSMLDGFIKILKKGTNSKNIYEKNSFLTDGSTLLNNLIQPENSPYDVGVLYNGDAIDALQADDNFANVLENAIHYIRPKNNITLLEGWIVPYYNSQETNDLYYDTIYEAVYKDVDKTEEEMLKDIIVPVKLPSFKKVTKKNEDGEDEEVLEAQYDKDRLKTSNKYGFIVDFDASPFLNNFNYINYTPSWKTPFEIAKKFYFNDQVASIVLKDGSEYAKPNSDGETYNFLMDENNIITSTKETLSPAQFSAITTDVSSQHSKSLLNLYISQQKYQTIYGTMPTEDTPSDQIYEVTYKALIPVTNQLRSELASYYTNKTKS